MLTVVDVEAEANANAATERTATASNLCLHGVDSPAMAQNSGGILPQNAHPSHVDYEDAALDAVVVDAPNARDGSPDSERPGVFTTLSLRTCQ